MRAFFSMITLALLLALPAAAQSYDWSNVGSVGITTAGNGSTFVGPTFGFSTFRTGTLTARYPVTNTYGSANSTTPPWTTLTASYTDNSANGSVTTKLIEVDKCSNTETTICTITSSDDSSPHCSTCSFNSNTFDFANNTYYVQVQIARTNTGATEALHSVGVN